MNARYSENGQVPADRFELSHPVTQCLLWHAVDRRALRYTKLR